ncbi:MAG TPA: tRNA uridine-5-carboxymethylaminomethyl(34) synthesis GTPase MnmE [Deltaproteobacteria bacterium]|nr:tRNA uridine-5-carboxymethylaminomethyl(34) synthesis GTPase MnmE [Deltaproteobacteria bacterium]
MFHVKHPLTPPDEDTIAAIATPFGIGGLGGVRISGPKALEIARRIFRPRHPPQDLPSHRLRYGHIVDPESGEVVDEVLLVFMRAPKTYTRQDVVEISGHGGYLVLKKILELVLREGAREAAPGEFTKRAFLAGRIDLTQAEAVLEVIEAQSEEALRLAQRQLEGRLSREVQRLKEMLLDLLVPLEAWLDLPEEEIPQPNEAELEEGIKGVLESMEKLLEHYRQEVVYREGIRTAIVGKPNVGKSSLLNRLLGRERAIVTPLPGTTTDLIEETIVLKGIPFRLVDMAGLSSPRDLVEEEGIRRARRQLEEADLLLLMVDRSRPLDEEDEDLFREVRTRGKPTLLVVNKVDLPAAFSPEELKDVRAEGPYFISALTGQGVEALTQAMVDVALRGRIRTSPGELVPLNLRHKRILEAVRDDLKQLLASLDEMPWDLVALELRGVLHRLGEIVGETTPEEVLEEIFSRFCIGK